MYLLRLSNGERIHDICLFKNLEEGRKSISKIPGYKYIKECDNDYSFEYETIDISNFPDYFELEYKGYKIPLTRFMFTEEKIVYIDWIEITDVDDGNSGYVEGTTLVDAYAINNQDVKEYISKREGCFNFIKNVLEREGFIVERSYFGSEDGEAILYSSNGENWKFFYHLDPLLTEDFSENKESIDWILENIEK